MSDEGFVLQTKMFREFRRGPNPEEAALDAVQEVSPTDVLDVGSGDGLFAHRVAQATGAKVLAVDISPRMVELTQSRGIPARLDDVQNLSFRDGSFDCVVANWMLYLASDLDRALSEVARVLRPQGRLVAGVVGKETFAEVRELLGDPEPRVYSLSAESGGGRLAYFSHVERRDVRGEIVFPDWKVLRDFVAMAADRAPLVDRIQPFEGPFTTRNDLAILVADK